MTFAENYGLRSDTSNLGFFYITPLRDEKIFPKNLRVRGKRIIFIA